MFDEKKEDLKPFSKSIFINADVSKVWHALTIPELMKKWMLEEEINIITDWRVGSQIRIEGKQHWAHFENKGIVLQFEKEKNLQYSHWSSLSRLPDNSENYTVFEFGLTQGGSQTELTLTINNFPTKVIYKHLVFYWDITLRILKKFIEEN